MRRPLFLMVLVCLLLAGALALQLSQPEERPTFEPVAAGGAAHDEAVTSPARFSMPPMSTFSEIAERPLFSRTRRPPTQEETAVEEQVVANPDALLLTGVILVDDDRTALLASPSSDRVTRVREGDELEGWTLVSVHPDKVVVRNGGTEQEIRLLDTLKMRDSPVRARAQRLRAEQLRAQQRRAQQARAEQRAAEEPPEEGETDEDQEETTRAQRIADRINALHRRNQDQQNQEEGAGQDEPFNDPEQIR